MLISNKNAVIEVSTLSAYYIPDFYSKLGDEVLMQARLVSNRAYAESKKTNNSRRSECFNRLVKNLGVIPKNGADKKEIIAYMEFIKPALLRFSREILDILHSN